MTRALLEELDYVGVLTLELFETEAGLVANELAPRVHNSGHWTLDGAVTSQFENHLRAILGWPLGVCAARGPTVMVNLLGEIPPASELLAHLGAHLHLYGKEPRPARKVGHVTVVGNDRKEVRRRGEALIELLHGRSEESA
jgi:5-(carboxyamino)imidazole ribonucleotide synthase